MITLTISTNGLGIRPHGALPEATPECHEASDIEHVRYAGDATARTVSVVRLTRAQAIALMDDIRSQIDYSDRAQDAVAVAMFTP